jgi:hypothetical protein
LDRLTRQDTIYAVEKTIPNLLHKGGDTVSHNTVKSIIFFVVYQKNIGLFGFDFVVLEVQIVHVHTYMHACRYYLSRKI